MFVNSQIQLKICAEIPYITDTLGIITDEEMTKIHIMTSVKTMTKIWRHYRAYMRGVGH
jgi:hypothetical protein